MFDFSHWCRREPVLLPGSAGICCGLLWRHAGAPGLLRLIIAEACLHKQSQQGDERCTPCSPFSFVHNQPLHVRVYVLYFMPLSSKYTYSELHCIYVLPNLKTSIQYRLIVHCIIGAILFLDINKSFSVIVFLRMYNCYTLTLSFTFLSLFTLCLCVLCGFHGQLKISSVDLPVHGEFLRAK